jgi:hypothetical protein
VALDLIRKYGTRHNNLSLTNILTYLAPSSAKKKKSFVNIRHLVDLHGVGAIRLRGNRPQVRIQEVDSPVEHALPVVEEVLRRRGQELVVVDDRDFAVRRAMAKAETGHRRAAHHGRGVAGAAVGARPAVALDRPLLASFVNGKKLSGDLARVCLENKERINQEVPSNARRSISRHMVVG